MTPIGDLNSRYWYEDNSGKVKRYVYCSLCLAGPFKESEEKKNFIQRGKSNFCLKCAGSHKYFNDPQMNQGIDTVIAPNRIKADPLKEDLTNEDLLDP